MSAHIAATSDETCMKIRLGQQVSALDAPFGDLTQIVVDPVVNTVTHLVVEPHRHHLQARLVPIDLVDTDDEGGLTVGLDTEHLRLLPRVSFTEFVPLASPIDVGDDWDVVGQTVIAQPYWGGDVLGMGRSWSEQAQVSFDRIPAGECEIRRRSRVVDLHGADVGNVEGLVVDGGHVGAVVVRAGLLGLHRLVVVPLGAVREVAHDAIELGIDRDAFDTLPGAGDLVAPDGASMPSPLEAQLAMAVHHASRWIRRIRSDLGRPRGGT